MDPIKTKKSIILCL